MTAPPLTGVRVVDTTTRWGEMAGRILAELGAEVVKLEPAEGCDSRRVGPFHEGESLYWAAMGAGKRSVMADDPEPYLADADVFIESGFRGDLSGRFPRLIHASVTPFGVDGPLADAPAAEVTVEAAGGPRQPARQWRPPAAPNRRHAAGSVPCRSAGGGGHRGRAQRTGTLGAGAAPRCFRPGLRRLDAHERHGLPAKHRGQPSRNQRVSRPVAALGGTGAQSCRTSCRVATAMPSFACRCR